MDKHKYLKHPINGRVLLWTPILAERGDMIPCDVEGNPLDEDCVMPGAVSFKIPDVIHSEVDVRRLGDPEKRKVIESQLNEEIRKGNEDWKKRNSLPYDGVMGILPEWIPERDRIRFGWESNLLLNEYAHEEILEFIELYPKYITGTLDDLRFAKMHKDLVQAIGYLTLIKSSIESGIEEGIRILAGDHAVRGFISVSSASKGGKKKGEIYSQKKADFLKKAKEIYEKRNTKPSNRELARLAVRALNPDLSDIEVEKQADVARHWFK